MSPSVAALALAVPAEPIHRLSVEQYRKMALAGILTPDDRVELLEGWLVKKMTKNPPHRIATRKTRVALEEVIPGGWYVDSQEPIVTGDSEPEPDATVIRGKTEDYADRNPPAAHVALVVEVADASLLRDRQLKARIYARAGIPCYWILNLADRRLEVYTSPAPAASAPSYAELATLGAADDVPVLLDGAEVGRIEVSRLLP